MVSFYRFFHSQLCRHMKRFATAETSRRPFVKEVAVREHCLWKIADVADYLDVPLSSVYKMTGPKSALRIPHVRIKGRVRFRKNDIDEWLELLKVSSNDVFARINARLLKNQ
jgi:excisionase family DNA binding protein